MRGSQRLPAVAPEGSAASRGAPDVSSTVADSAARVARGPVRRRDGWGQLCLRICVAAYLCAGLTSCGWFCDNIGIGCGTIEKIGNATTEAMVPLMEEEFGRTGRVLSVAVADPMNLDWDDGNRCPTALGRQLGARIYWAIGESSANGKAFGLTTRGIVSAFVQSKQYRGDWWNRQSLAQWGNAQSIKYLVRGEYWWADPELVADPNTKMLSVNVELVELETGRVCGVYTETLGPFSVVAGLEQRCPDKETERERLARLERERLARLEQERLARLEQERLARSERERSERERLERVVVIPRPRLAPARAISPRDLGPVPHDTAYAWTTLEDYSYRAVGETGPPDVVAQRTSGRTRRNQRSDVARDGNTNTTTLVLRNIAAPSTWDIQAIERGADSSRVLVVLKGGTNPHVEYGTPDYASSDHATVTATVYYDRSLSGVKVTASGGGVTAGAIRLSGAVRVNENTLKRRVETPIVVPLSGGCAKALLSLTVTGGPAGPTTETVSLERPAPPRPTLELFYPSREPVIQRSGSSGPYEASTNGADLQLLAHVRHDKSEPVRVLFSDARRSPRETEIIGRNQRQREATHLVRAPDVRDRYTVTVEYIVESYLACRWPKRQTHQLIFSRRINVDSLFREAVAADKRGIRAVSGRPERMDDAAPGRAYRDARRSYDEAADIYTALTGYGTIDPDVKVRAMYRAAMHDLRNIEANAPNYLNAPIGQAESSPTSIQMGTIRRYADGIAQVEREGGGAYNTCQYGAIGDYFRAASLLMKDRGPLLETVLNRLQGADSRGNANSCPGTGYCGSPDGTDRDCERRVQMDWEYYQAMTAYRLMSFYRSTTGMDLAEARKYRALAHRLADSALDSQLPWDWKGPYLEEIRLRTF